MAILSGCGRHKYKTLSQIPSTNRFSSTDAALKGSYTVLDGQACKEYLGTNVGQKGYQALYITVSNDTNRALYFDTQNINIATVNPAEVTKAVHTNPKARAIGLGIPGAIVVGSGATLLASPFLGGFLIFAPIIAIPTLVIMGLSITPAIKTTKDAIQINKNIDDNCLHNQMIAPHTSVSGLVFMQKKSFNPNFQIAFHDSAGSITKPFILASNPAQATSVA
jgi:hypothetical protein